ncbi:hypothetical protein BMS3Bbin10_01331 [bacterium BMS3Bbin10]|nr:hypothetical protein BMS3Bbin10_01331 [bacterium BMS3Bbin10]
MSLPIKAEVKTHLSDYHSRIYQIVMQAWEEWEAISKYRAEQGIAPLLYSRTIANYVFDAIARKAILEFLSDDHINLIIEAQTIKIVFKGLVIGRFKKGDEHKLGRNIATQAVLAFTDPQESFLGFPPETVKVDFVWLSNDLCTRVKDILVVARDNERLLWDYSIKDIVEDAGEVVTLPTAASPQGDDRTALVSPRGVREQVSKSKE